MDTGNMELGIIFLTQTGVGILGNFSLLCFYNYSLFTANKLRPTDLILNQLAVANSLVLFSKGIPQTTVAFLWKYFLDDAGCKLIFYCYRVGTGVSLSTVCLLNGFQVIKLSPSICRWIELKIRSPKFISFCCSLCWILHLLINSFLLVIVSSPLNKKNLTTESNYGYCSYTMPDDSLLYTALYFSPDIMTLGFMIWASVYMVLFLHRHKHRVQHIHSQSLSKSGRSHEARATCTILILVSFFFAFYSMYTILTIWTTLSENNGQWTVNSSVLLSSCFPAFSPFVIIFSDTRISQFCLLCIVRKNCFSKLLHVL